MKLIVFLISLNALYFDCIGQSKNAIWCFGDSAGAVSYTHLRAHETVLDLVCRLMLVKKKNIHIKTFNALTPSITDSIP